MYEAEGPGNAMRNAFMFALSAVILAVLAILIITAIPTDDSDADVGEDIEYQDLIYRVLRDDPGEDGIRLAGLRKIPNSKTNDVNVQSSVVGKSGASYKVVEVMDDACQEGYSFKTLSLPLTVTKIGNNAFAGCSKLETISGLSNVSVIGEYAFANCSLLKNAMFSADIDEIKAGTFLNCVSLSNVSLPNTIKRMGDQAFDGCSNLGTLKLPDSLEELGDGVFSGCSRLSSADMPSTVIKIGKNLYSDCTSLVSAAISPKITDITSSMFSGCRNLRDLSMSNSVSWIGQYAFSGCTSLSKITISSNVKFIGNFAFKDIEFRTMDGTVITDSSNLPGFTYVQRDGIMYRQEVYSVHYDPNGGPSITDDEPHIAGRYFIPTRYESGALVCEDWIYNGKEYHYGDRIYMPGEDITLLCVWTHVQRSHDDDTGSSENNGSTNSLIGLAAVGVTLAALLSVSFFTRRNR